MRYLSLKINGIDVNPPAGIPTGGESALSKVLQTGMQTLFVFAIVFALFVIIFGAIQWITSGGDKQKLEGARKRIIFAIVGLLVVLFAFFIVNLVGSVFGVTLLQN